jgi:hypothetical protein
LQEVVHVFCCGDTGCWEWYVLVDIAEAYAGGLVDEDDVGVLAPAVLIVDGPISMFIWVKSISPWKTDTVNSFTYYQKVSKSPPKSMLP